jgi:hypothetical protein
MPNRDAHTQIVARVQRNSAQADQIG